MMTEPDAEKLGLEDGDALLIVDVQNDFLPGGALPVRGGDQVAPILSRYLKLFAWRNLPVYATRDWHPPLHCSFRAQGGPWPPHCVAGTAGAKFCTALRLPPATVIISKASDREQDAYSGFEHTELHERLRAARIRRLFVGGLATDYCVLNTVRDAIRLGYVVFLLGDAIRAVEVDRGDGQRAEDEMIERGAQRITVERISE
jgi:nicotinamidase/pyrazinamidase